MMIGQYRDQKWKFQFVLNFEGRKEVGDSDIWNLIQGQMVAIILRA